MRKRAVLSILMALEIAGLMLSALFWFVMRRDLLVAYDPRALPFTAKLGLSAWFVPMTGVAGALAMLIALFPGWRTKTRTYLAGAGLVCTVFGLAFAIGASYAPVFEQLGH